MIYIIGLIDILIGGIFHAFFIKHFNTFPHKSKKWHAAQWLPLLSGAIGFLMVGIYLAGELGLHNGFGYFGLFAAPFAAGGLGYVLGYHIFWRTIK